MTFNAAEKHQSQIPALQLLVALGFTPLSQAEALRLRAGRLRNVVLDDILADQLLRINSFTHRDREYPFDLADAHEAMRRLKPTPDRTRGLKGTNQDVYDSLVLGTTITKTIDGDSKSYSFRFIDWEHPENNVFHVTAEFAVERTGSTQTKRCDIVGFVNGIPFLVIDMVVASVLMSLGMMMLSPTIISLPFKLLLFVLVDGWALLMGSLALSFS